MDTERVDAADLAACLADLRQVNTVTLARPPTLRVLARAARIWRARGETRPLRVLDVGFGDGDMLRAVRRWGDRRGVALDLAGIDINPDTARAARAATPAAMRIEYVSADLFAHRPDVPPDLVISSLFAHHLDDAQLVRFLRWMEGTARLGWFVNDLHRHAIAYHGFRALAGLARWHRFVRHDGPVSVARAFRHADWAAALERAGIDPDCVQVRWHVPFRLCVARLR